MAKWKKSFFTGTTNSRKHPLLAYALAAALAAGPLTGCSSPESAPTETAAVSSGSSETAKETTSAPTVQPSETTAESSAPEAPSLSADGETARAVAENFAAAYFAGRAEELQDYLTEPYPWAIDVYEGDGTAKVLAIKGLEDIGEEEIGTVSVVSLEFQDSAGDEGLLYLTLEMLKQPDGWDIQFYGLER